MLAPQPVPSILNDVDLQAEHWRRLNEEKVAVIEELESEVGRLEAEVIEAMHRVDTADERIAAQTVEATFYTAFCPTGCIGITATGLDVSKTIYTPEGLRVIAVDPNVIKLGSIVNVTLANGDSFKAQACDTGGNIKGARIDVLVESRDEAYRLGRQSAKVEIVDEGER